ncbi:MAG: hypothetical protein WCJ55_15520 [Chloroflexales bacterium]
MNINLNQKQTRIAGITLITIGVVAVFHLWWAILPVFLAAGGVAIYRRQRALGRTGEAVQGVLWGLGLALLLLIHFIFPGILLLGGASLLLRGRELEADQRAHGLLTNLTSRRPAAPAPAQPVAQPRATIISADEPSTGETVRLR